MRLRLSLRTLSLIILVLLAIIALISAVNSYLSTNRISEINSLWNAFQVRQSEKSRLLSALHEELGYGGMIHNFKNYLLRKDSRHYNNLVRSLGSSRLATERYLSLSTSPKEKTALKDIGQMLDNYSAALQTVQKEIKKDRSSNDIDKLVVVDDSLALEGLAMLKSELSEGIDDITLLLTRDHLITELRLGLGYGGMIHAFKNFVLRKDREYKNNTLTNIERVEATIARYYKLNLSIDEEHALEAISDVLANYKSKLSIIENSHKHNLTAERIDSQVKIDDSSALNALRFLENVHLKNIQDSAADLSQRISRLKSTNLYNAIFLIGLVIISASLIYWFFSKQIISPVLKIADSMNQLSNGNIDIQIPLPKNSMQQLKTEIEFMYDALHVFRETEVQRRQSELALYDAKVTAENAVKVKSEFLACMSHEIRTPMNGVIGMLGLLRESQLSDEQRYRLSLAEKSATSLLSVINDILDFSKIEAGKLELEILEFNIANILSDIIETISMQLTNKNVELILDTYKLSSMVVKSDPGRLRQIITNLVGNAIKFTEQGEIIITTDIQPDKTSSNPDSLIFSCSVTDTGVGIPENKLNSLFDSFSQVDTSTTRKYGGTGLGLSITQQLCRLMGGEITVSSTEGQGSTFSFSIKLEKGAESYGAVPDFSLEQFEALIVDDNETNLEILSKQVENMGGTVTSTTSARQALRICKTRSDDLTKEFFDICILDMEMPEMNGVEFVKAIKQHSNFNNMKIIMLTSTDDQNDVNYYSEIGVNAYFSKPAAPDDLYKAIKIVLDVNKIHSTPQPLITKNYLNVLTRDRPIQHVHGQAEIAPTDTRILLVEDVVVNQIVAQGILESVGLYAELATNGIEALESLKNAPNDAPYTCILMDIQMPEMDGYTATRQIRKGVAGDRYTSIPIIAMTANAMKEDRDKCLQAGMSDYISKPVNSDELIQMLHKWLNRRS